MIPDFPEWQSKVMFAIEIASETIVEELGW